MTLPTILSNQIYVLKLQNDKWYVGKTSDVYQRYTSHCTGEGSMWTSLHPPIRIEEVFKGDDFDEDKTTKKYMKEYGIDNVRGGSYVTVALTFEQRKLIMNEINMATSACLGCGDQGHFIKECPLVKPEIIPKPKSSQLIEAPRPEKRPVYSPGVPRATRVPKIKCERCGWRSHSLDQCFAKTDHLSRTLVQRGQERKCEKCQNIIYHDSQCWCHFAPGGSQPL